MSSSLKKLIIGLGLIVVVFGAYLLLQGSDDMGGASGVIRDPALTEQSQSILMSTNKIQSFNTDTALFRRIEFTSLTDTRSELPEVPTGRTNPFAPL